MKSDATYLFGKELVDAALRDGQTPSDALADRWAEFVRANRSEPTAVFRARLASWSATLARSELLAVVRLVAHGPGAMLEGRAQ